MKRKIVLCLWLAMLGFNAYGQKEYVNLMKQAHKALNKGHHTESLRFSKMMIRLNGSDYRGYYYEGLANYFLANNEESIAALDKALSHMKRVIEDRVPYFKGLSYYNLGQYDSAVSCIKWAIEINAKDVSYYVDLADSYYRLNSDSCIYYYDKAIALRPKDRYPYRAKALYYYWNDRYLESLPLFDKALKMDAKNAEMYLQRSFANYMVDNYDNAITDAKKAIALEPANEKSQYYLGLYYQDIDLHAEAIEAFKKSVLIKPDYTHALFKMAYSQYYLDLYPEALQNINKAIEGDGEKGHYYRIRGYIRYEVADKEGACEDWTIAAGMGLEDAREMVTDHCEKYLRDAIW